MNEPMILTLKLDEKTQQFFDVLRKRHFPSHINYLQAHCTLFHKLPQGNASIQEMLVACRRLAPIKLKINSVRNIGNGVAYSIEAAELIALHKKFQRAFAPWLISQDRQPL